MSVEQAVDLAASMLREGQHFGRAVTVASRSYGVAWGDVQRGLASRGGRSHARRPLGPTQPAPAPRPCEVCGAQPAALRGTPYAGSVRCPAVFTCEGCGRRLPSWYETDARNPITRVAWTAYRTSPEGTVAAP